MFELPTKAFMILQPAVSKGFKRTYHKKIEVYECELDIAIDRYYKKKKHLFKNNKWEISDLNKRTDSMRIIVRGDLYTESSSGSGGTEFYFESFELAYISKVLMIQNMGETYLKNLEELKEQYKRNVPNVNNHLDIIKDKYSEYMI